MELFRTDEFYIFVQGEYSLWWDRLTGAFIPKTDWDLTDADDPVCLGICQGIIGKIYHPSVFDTRLLLIKESSVVGTTHGDHVVYKIKSIQFLNLGSENTEVILPPCSKHKSRPVSNRDSGNQLFKGPTFTKTLGTLKNCRTVIKTTTQTAGNVLKNTTQQAAAMAAGTPKKREGKDKGKFEKQILDEFYKIFTDTNSFYYCLTTDITSSLQRLCNLEKDGKLNPKCIWKTVDDRFFWNKNMLTDLLESFNPLCDPWILPIIQGFVQIEECKVPLEQDIHGVKTSPKIEIFKLSIISRRSRFRAGTRYKRRGVDEEGECANYVETEQIVSYHHHEVSFVQVRGSVPVYWSQPGYKYRPPPRIDRDENETKIAFEKHFNKEITTYGPVCVVNLVDQTGREKIIWDAYSHHILQFNSKFITYVTFDFHEYCRGMHFENVSILMASIADIVKDMQYCWRDQQGHICSQVGVFRVNCIDCLDRTNVVQKRHVHLVLCCSARVLQRAHHIQAYALADLDLSQETLETAIGKAVMEIQFSKLGLISPEGVMPESIKNVFQLLWANNGDTISKQYAGTNALKGDYTRTGERKFSGIMKDGMNSANRYLKNIFTDSLRQSCLDLMQGKLLGEIEIQDMWTYLRILNDIASEFEPLTPPSHIPHIALQQEYELANAIYYMTRYYLSRFKDTTRQGTIDVMLGNFVSVDSFSDISSQQDEDSVATAEHVKILIEDCKKMLLSNFEEVLGSWGLINGDPVSGDPSETEMDTILILTKDSYFVADYDEEVDKVTKYQKVALSDLTHLECGVPESNTPAFLKITKDKFSIRFNYKVDGVTGYYHMFRSTNLRFFNNMAVVIRSEEEEIESLKAICEAFLVALEIVQLPPIPFHQGQKLDRRKSKIINTHSDSTRAYLDIASLPQITRNVSETQLLALKSVGTKALSNMSQQFTKLNKFTTPFKQKTKQAKFIIGKTKAESSSDSEDDYETSIFQPDASAGSGSLQYATDSSSSAEHHVVEEAEEAKEETALDIKVPDTYLPGVGIVMGSTNESQNNSEPPTLVKRESILNTDSSSQVNNVQLSSIMKSVSITSPTPDIQISSEEMKVFEGSDTKLQPPQSIKLDRKLSHSSGEVDITVASESPSQANVCEGRFDKRSNSAQDVALNISQSQSESALKSKLQNLTSPVANATKDLVMNPFSKFAKGVQNFGANLDPRKATGVRQISERDYEEHRRLQEKWRDCNTRLIAL